MAKFSQITRAEAEEFCKNKTSFNLDMMDWIGYNKGNIGFAIGTPPYRRNKCLMMHSEVDGISTYQPLAYFKNNEDAMNCFELICYLSGITHE